MKPNRKKWNGDTQGGSWWKVIAEKRRVVVKGFPWLYCPIHPIFVEEQYTDEWGTLQQ